MPMFVTSVFTRLSAFTAEQLSDFFSLLEPLPIMCRFKIALCQKHITRTSSNDTAGTRDSRPKPQVRAQPRSHAPVHRPTRNDEEESKQLNTVTTIPASIVGRHPPTTSTEILEMLRIPEPRKDTSKGLTAARAFIHMKFELIVAFGNLQSSTSSQERDPEWMRILRDGRLDQAMDSAFHHSGDGYGQTCLKALSGIVSLWRTDGD